jgi:hypothetical protein
MQQAGAPAVGTVAKTPKDFVTPVGANTAPVAQSVVIDRGPYEIAHRQMPRPEAYQTVNGKALAPAR